MYNRKPPRWLLLQNCKVFCFFPMALLCFFYSMHKTVFVYLSMSFTSVVDTTKRMSVLLYPPPSVSSYCDDDDGGDDDDDEPMSTYVSLFLCFSFATRHYKYYGIEKKGKKTQINLAFRSTVVRCCVPENHRLNKVHILILKFQHFQLWFLLCTWQWVWR